MNIEKNDESIKSLITKFENIGNEKSKDEFKMENIKLKNDDDSEWLEENYCDNDENENISDTIQNVENELSDDNNCSDNINELTNINSLNRPVLRSKTEINSRNKVNIVKFYSENNYPQIGLSLPEDATSSTSSSALTPDSDILAPIIDELILTEKNFVKNLKFGLENYSKLFDDEYQDELPKSLIGKNYVLLRNIDDIIDFHENQFLPMLLTEMNDYKKLFEKISEFVNDNQFYSHLLYNMNMKGATKLYNENRDFFKQYEEKIGDRLGLNSFLMQPVIRLTKYPLLLKEIMKKCFKNFEDKFILQSCCIAEKRLSDFLTIVNESEQVNDIEECDDKINISYQGRFKKVDTFHVYNNNIDRGYNGKLFLFEKSLIYTEIMDTSLIYRGCYPFENLGINVKEAQFTVYFDMPGINECLFLAEKPKIDLWTKLIRDNLKEFFMKNRKMM